MLRGHREKVSSLFRVCAGAPGITLGRSVVARVLHEVCVGWEGCPGEFVWWQHDAGVNQEGEGLGQSQGRSRLLGHMGPAGG